MEKIPETLQCLLDDFYASRPLSQSARQNYYKALLSYCRVTGAAGLSDLCNQNLTKWYVVAQREFAPKTISLYALDLRKLYAHILCQQGLTGKQAELKAGELFEVIPFAALRKAAAKANQLRNKIISPQEFNALMAAADHPRVRAILVTDFESAGRPGEVLGLRVRDAEFRDFFALIHVYGKTGERTIPLVRSIPYLRAWLQVHPLKDDPDAPLFIRPYKGKLKQVTLAGFQSTFRHLKKKAGIKRRVHLYMYRHTRLTDLAKGGIGDFQMKEIAGWTKDSHEASVYIHMSGRDSIPSILKLEGIQVEQTMDPKAKSPIDIKICPRCGSTNEADATYCGHCNLILDDKVLQETLRLETRTDNIMTALMNHPLVRNAIRGALEELKASGKLPAQIGG